MKRLPAIALAVITIMAGSAFGQAKVGTTVAEFLQLPSSLRSAGMGDITTVLTDRQAYSGNPGSIGLISAQPEISLGPLLWSKLPGGVNYYGAGSVLPLNTVDVPAGQSTSLGIAAYSSLLRSGPFDELTYERIPTGRSFHWTDGSYHLLVGLGINKRLQVGLGAGLTYARESVLDYSADGWATDLGLIARLPIRLGAENPEAHSRVSLTPVLGASLTNFGPDMEFIKNTYPLPRTFRAGLGTELAVTVSNLFHGWQVLSAATALEYNKQRDRDSFTRTGAELGLGEAFYLRVGHEDEDGTNTWGFAVGSSGLTRLLLWTFGDPTQFSPTAEFFASKLTIEYAQSSTTPNGAEKAQILRGFTLTYRYGD